MRVDCASRPVGAIGCRLACSRGNSHMTAVVLRSHNRDATQGTATLHATIELDSRSALRSRAAIPSLHETAKDSVIAALAEALSSGECYELVERGGALFVQPVAAAPPVRSTPPAFSPDARARHEALVMAA